MTLLDSNILLYAYDIEAPQHSVARVWLEELLSASDLVGLPWLTVWAFLRISTNRRVLKRPLAVSEAFQIVQGWLARPNVVVVQPGARHASILERLATDNQAGGLLITDAALAALAIEHGATLASTDHDFKRFPGIQWVNPLQRSL